MLRRLCCIVVWHTPLLLPLITVCGVQWGGVGGWIATAVACGIAYALRMWRVLLCSLLCGSFVFLCGMERRAAGHSLQDALLRNHAVTLEGVVVKQMKRGCVLESSWLGVRVALRGDMPWQCGDILRVTAESLPPSSSLVEGMFSQEKWMRDQGLVANLSCLHSEKLGRSWGWSSLVGAACRVRERLADILMPPGTEADMRSQVLCAMALGEKDRADAMTMDAFRRGGCLHAFAVSGLHVGLVAGLLWLLIKFCCIHPRIGRVILLIGVGLYVIATGLAVPALRAYLMLLALLFGIILRRRASMFNTWCFAALLILLIEPWQLYQAGFQLSFLIYAAICLGVTYAMGGRAWFGPDDYIPTRIHTRFERAVISAEFTVRGTIIVSLCAWLASLPIVAAQFHVINTGSYLTNIAISPLLPIVMFFAFMTLIFGQIPILGPALHYAAMKSAGWMVSVISIFGSYPGAYLPAHESAPPQDYMLACMYRSKSFCVLGNPGVLIGNLQREDDARYSVEPALFHAGFSPALVWDAGGGAAEDIYRKSWPNAAFRQGNMPQPLSIRSAAGSFTLYFSPDAAPAEHVMPIVIWERPDGSRFMYIGDAPISILESIPPHERHADTVILGFSAHEPLIELPLIRSLGAHRIILLPSAAAWNVSSTELAPAILRRLSSESLPVIRPTVLP